MNQIERTFITSKLVDALYSAKNSSTPEERYTIYQDSIRLLTVLLKGSKPLSKFIEAFPTVVFHETESDGLNVYPPNSVSLSRCEAIDWRNRLLAEGLGELSLFKVMYALGGFVEFTGETEESTILGSIVASYGENWKVFSGIPHTINLVSKTAYTYQDALTQSDLLATKLKDIYPSQIIVVRINLIEPVDGQTEIRVVKR